MYSITKQSKDINDIYFMVAHEAEVAIVKTEKCDDDKPNADTSRYLCISLASCPVAHVQDQEVFVREKRK